MPFAEPQAESAGLQLQSSAQHVAEQDGIDATRLLMAQHFFPSLVDLAHGLKSADNLGIQFPHQLANSIASAGSLRMYVTVSLKFRQGISTIWSWRRGFAR
jgi:hypothetical protein